MSTSPSPDKVWSERKASPHVGASVEWTYYFKRELPSGLIRGGFVVEHFYPSGQHKFVTSIFGEAQTFLDLEEAKAWVECRVAVLLAECEPP